MHLHLEQRFEPVGTWLAAATEGAPRGAATPSSPCAGTTCERLVEKEGRG